MLYVIMILLNAAYSNAGPNHRKHCHHHLSRSEGEPTSCAVLVSGVSVLSNAG